MDTRTRPFSGLVIGGPLDGRTIEATTDVLIVPLKVADTPMFLAEDADYMEKPENVEYRYWSPGGGLCLWLAQHTTPAEAIARLFDAYQQKIRPELRSHERGGA